MSEYKPVRASVEFSDNQFKADIRTSYFMGGIAYHFLTMSSLTRRSVLKAASAWAFLAAWPGSTCAGLLDRILRPQQASRTPSITPNEEFYVTSYRSPPIIRIEEWALLVTGLVEKPITLTYDQLLEKPTVSSIVTLECIGNTVAGEFISTAKWEGISLGALLDEAGVNGSAYDVVFKAADGFSDSIRFQRAMAGDVLIAHRMNGVPLPQGHGFPARVVVPGHYGMKSVQWLTEIEVVNYDYKGYYQRKGWTDDAIVKTMSRIDLPGHGTTIPGLHHRVQGLAFAGTRGIRLVEISIDNGGHWTAATLEPPSSPYAWNFWSYDCAVPAPGRYTMLVRATDGTGKVQASLEQDPAPDGATGLHEITVTVSV